jgi:hypothetical protein
VVIGRNSEQRLGGNPKGTDESGGSLLFRAARLETLLQTIEGELALFGQQKWTLLKEPTLDFNNPPLLDSASIPTR